MECAVIRIAEGKEYKYDPADSAKVDLLYNKLQEAVKEPEIVYRGNDNLDKITEALSGSKGFITYVVFKSFMFGAEFPDEKVLPFLTSFARDSNVVDIVEKTYSWQLLHAEFYDFDEDVPFIDLKQ